MNRAVLDATRIAGVVIVHLLLALAAGEHHLIGVDDDDVVAAIDVGRVVRLMLAAQALPARPARRPTTRPFASITTHFFSTSAGFSEVVVFIALFPVGRQALVLKTTNRREMRRRCDTVIKMFFVASQQQYAARTTGNPYRIWLHCNGINKYRYYVI